MNIGLYLTFIVAAVVLIVVPGPTVMLVTSTSLRRGRRAGLVAVAGSTLAAALQLGIVVTGLASIVALAGQALEWIRWAGALYLIFLGVRTWNATRSPSQKPAASALTRAFAQGFVVTLTNPKTLLFLGAFLPQFVDPTLPAAPQLTMLAVTFLLVAWLLDSAWALLADKAGNALKSLGAQRLAQRVSASILIAGGVALATVHRG